MSSLRERIAAVLRQEIKGIKWVTPESMADAVLTELHLHPERGRLKVVRYVTEWEVDVVDD